MLSNAIARYVTGNANITITMTLSPIGYNSTEMSQTQTYGTYVYTALQLLQLCLLFIAISQSYFIAME